MRAAPPLVFPSSRVLAGWWQQFAPLAPQSLAVGHLLLHHVEALVLSERSPAFDPFAAFVLRALVISSPLPLAELDERLHVGRQLLGRILGELASGGLAVVEDGQRWRATAAGHALTESGESRRAGYERRAFHFRAAPQPRFVPLAALPCHPIAPPDTWVFDPDVLRQSIAQTSEWKRRHGFPADVRAILTPDVPERPGEPPSWQRVVVDQPEHLVLALIVVAGKAREGELNGYVIDPRGWRLDSLRPVLTMNGDWAEAFPEVTPGPSAEGWRSAWRAWCQARGVAVAEADACGLSREGPILRVTAPRELLGRLHSANGEAARDEVWLLAGEGTMRTAARVEVV
jgi:hypothetical protein